MIDKSGPVSLNGDPRRLSRVAAGLAIEVLSADRRRSVPNTRMVDAVQAKLFAKALVELGLIDYSPRATESTANDAALDRQ